MTENLIQHDRTKHVEVDRHFIKGKARGKNNTHPVCLI